MFSSSGLFYKDDIPSWVYYSIMGSAYMIYYYCNAVKPPLLKCSSSKYTLFLKNYVPAVTEKYWPTFWCFESRMQTVLASALNFNFDLSYEREILSFDDGGEVALDWVNPENTNQLAPIILLLPGLTGSSKTTYMKKFVVSATKIGCRSVVFNYRGLGGLDLKTPQTYCATSTHDLYQVINHIKNKFPQTNIAATGISLGTLILGNYLSKYTDESSHLCAAMMVSAPYDVFKANKNIECGINVLLNRHLVNNLVGTVKNTRHILDIDGKPWKMDEVMRSKTIREFDHTFTAKQFGYQSAEHYYKDANLVDKLESITIPVLCLSAADDPFQPLMDLADVQSRFNHESVALLVTARGGHIAFLEGIWPFNKQYEYMHRVFTQFFTAILNNQNYLNFITN